MHLSQRWRKSCEDSRRKIFSLEWSGVNGPYSSQPWSPQVARERGNSFERASPMQCSWSQVVSGASQLLQQILAQSVSSFTSFKAVVREQPSLEIDGTMRTAFHKLKENDHLRASINTIWSHSASEASLWGIPCGNWCRVFPRGEWWDWATHCFCF